MSTPVDWRRIVATALAAVLIAVVGFSAGRYSAPLEVEERVEYRTEWKEKRVEVVKWRTARAVDTRTTTTPVLLPVPDGGVVLATATTTETRERETATARLDTAIDLSGNTTGSTSRKVTQQADWRLGVQVGASLRDPLLPIAGPLVLGASVERRIAGGISAGAWLNTSGAAGASISLEF